MPTADEVLALIKSMPRADQWRIYGELYEHLEPADEDPVAVAEAWRAEIERRSAACDAGLVQGIPWEQVKAEARARAGRPSDG
ncbi:MAG TPA: addiction module protein [Gemmataceae bacterium]|jgi:putative addiction module component (TIGR02574 family)